MRHASRALTALVTLALLPLVAFAAPGSGSRPDVVSALDALLAAEAGLKGGVQGVIVQSLADGQVWYQRDADLLLLPASNQKLLTSAAALVTLGPGWRFRTRLVAVGKLDAHGVLRGDLYLVGGGDPLLERAHLAALAQSARRAGIREVTGSLCADESVFDEQRYGDGWAWDDMPWYYSAQVSGLNVDRNVVEVRVDPGERPGAPVRVRLSPNIGYLEVSNRARTSARGGSSSLAIGRSLGRNHVTVTGDLAVGAPDADHEPEPIAVEDPARYAAALMHRALRKEGVRVRGGATLRKLPAGPSRQVGLHASAPLSTVLARLNKASDNLVAECLLRSLSAARGKERRGSWAEGRDVAAAALISLGLDSAGLDLADGSGLSRRNRVTARTLLRALTAMRDRPEGGLFAASLPVAGVDGTLRNRMKGTPAEGNCRAKSGYVSSVSSLSGFVTTADGEPLAFSILMNNHKARNAVATAVQNRMVVYLASHRSALP